MQAQAYDFALTPGGSQQLSVVGSSIKLLTSTGALMIVTDTGARLTVLPGQGLRHFDFSTITLVDKSGSGNVGTLLISSGEMIDDRISGEVSVIDGGKSRTIANQAFVGLATIGASAANYSVAEIQNPAGSGRRIIVKSYKATVDGGGYVWCGFWSGAGLSLPILGVSKKDGALASSAVMRREQVAALSLANRFDQGLGTCSTVLQEPIVLSPGVSLRFEQVNVNSGIAVSFEWIEELL